METNQKITEPTAELALKNIDACDRFSQSYGVRIEKLFWIAVSWRNADLKEAVKDMDLKDWNSVFPDIKDIKKYTTRNRAMEAIFDYKKFGFFARIEVPVISNFMFKNNTKKPFAWDVNEGHRYIYYVYGETREQLLVEIEKVAKASFEKCLALSLKKKHKSK